MNDIEYPTITIECVEGGYIITAFKSDPNDPDEFYPSKKIATTFDELVFHIKHSVQDYESISPQEAESVERGIAASAKKVNENPPAPAKPKRPRKPKDQ